jgi:replicative DNA helicase
VSTSGRLPFSESAERTLIATCLINQAWLDEALALVDHEMFCATPNRILFKAMAEVRTLGVAVDVVTVRRWIEKHGHGSTVSPTYIADILNLEAVTTNIREYARIIFNCWRLRRMHEVCSKFAARIESETTPDNVQEFLDEVAYNTTEVGRSPEVSGVEWIGDSVRNAFVQLRDRAKAGLSLSGAPTGYPGLDGILDGLQSGRVVVVAGRPGMGKSALAQAVATNVARNGLGAAYFSLEMPKQELAFRSIFSNAMIDSNEFKTRKLEAEDWSRMTFAAKELHALPLVLDDSPLTFPQLRAKTTQIKAECERKGAPLKVVVIDHLLLLSPEKQFRGDEKAQIKANTRRMKDMAKELDLCVIELSQLNRNVESRAVKDKRPQLADLRDCGSIEQDADAVVLLYRADYYERDSTKHNHIVECLVPKNRCGSTGYVKLRFEAKYTRFDNLGFGDEP